MLSHLLLRLLRVMTDVEFLDTDLIYTAEYMQDDDVPEDGIYVITLSISISPNFPHILNLYPTVPALALTPYARGSQSDTVEMPFLPRLTYR